MTTKKATATTTKATARKTATSNKKPTRKDPAPKRTPLGSFEVADADAESHKCSGACAQVLPVRKFPTTKVAGVRVSECRSCRDARTKKATTGKASK